MKTMFYALYKKSTFVLDADISGCFDNIKHNALLEKLNTTPTLKRTVKKWLRAGVMESGTFQPTESGTIQGGAFSPLLACIALHGLEQYVKENLKGKLLSIEGKSMVQCYKVRYNNHSGLFFMPIILLSYMRVKRLF